jgi:nucleoside-diphosphate-sugar epimerase
MKNIIITGATGFIGSWLAEELLCQGISVTALVRDSKKLLPQLIENENFKYVLCDYDNLLATPIDKSIHYDAFYNLGWGGVAPQYKNDIDIQLGNMRNAIQAIQLSASIGCDKFISSGTVAEYAYTDEVMNVYQRQTPNDLYGAAKVSAHYFLEVLSRQLNQDFIWAVIPSTFGERRVDSNIITYTIKTLLKHERPQYGHLNQMWDFLYVSEVVRALRLIGEKGIAGKTYGIGSGTYRPLKYYISCIRDIIDPDAELGIREVPNMSKQTFSSCVNIWELTKDTEFMPEISFEEGIKKTIEWFKLNQLY